MRKDRTGALEKTNMRRRAEDRLKADESATGSSVSGDKSQKLYQELQIHQIELEMQNDELRRIQTELEASQKKHYELYDLAPVGYLTLSAEGLILDGNLKASTLLGVSRGDLIKQPLTRFILPKDQDEFYLYYKRLLSTHESQELELRMLAKESHFWVRLQTNIADDAGDSVLYRVVISDISKRKLAEEALQKAHESLEKQVEERTWK